jgi:hypothetical protein
VGFDGTGIGVAAIATTPLLGQVMLAATWTNTLQHAADPHDYSPQSSHGRWSVCAGH